MADSKAEMTFLGFDYGTSWIGVAYGQRITNTAKALKVLRARDGIPNWDEITELIQEWHPDALIVGNPLNMDDSVSELSQRANKFKNRLHGRFGLPAYSFDERLSSYEAKGLLLENNKGNHDFRSQHVDALAAQIILQGWLDQHTS
ncbi:Holliday junction resolvase RuvX [Gynuella sp.]|uniref:Holliday junction resolvase RuvX n=1 Tax=Gynuella sp. TaxID=2969146 RepID=UPI003D0AE60E